MLRPSRARPVEPSGFDTAARADLALAIAARGAHAQASAVLDGAWGSLNATLAAARGELEAAQAELAVAQGKAAEDAVSAALGGIPSPAGDVPAARAKLQAAQDALSVAGVAFENRCPSARRGQHGRQASWPRVLIGLRRGCSRSTPLSHRLLSEPRRCSDRLL